MQLSNLNPTFSHNSGSSSRVGKFDPQRFSQELGSEISQLVATSHKDSVENSLQSWIGSRVWKEYKHSGYQEGMHGERTNLETLATILERSKETINLSANKATDPSVKLTLNKLASEEGYINKHLMYGIEMFQLYKSILDNIYQRASRSLPIWKKKGIVPVIDIDETTLRSTHNLRITPKDFMTRSWDENLELAKARNLASHEKNDCPPIAQMAKLIKKMDDLAIPHYFVTGRNSSQYDATRKNLNKYGLLGTHTKEILMRNNYENKDVAFNQIAKEHPGKRMVFFDDQSGGIYSHYVHQPNGNKVINKSIYFYKIPFFSL
jgi:hypothetical protein